jgi:dTDP-4-dehydrorhamnose 3,5-epimerase
MPKITQTPLPGVLLIEPQLYRDSRGFFFESYNQKVYAAAGLIERFVQDNHSRSERGTLRGMHAQFSHPQGKLIRVLAGEIFDVVIDIRKGSPTFKKWYSVNLSSENFLQCYIPPGFAHGFCVLSETTEVEYKVTDYYDPTDELHLIWNDPEIGIEWPIKDPILSPKDRAGVLLKDIAHRLPVYIP